MKETQYDLPLTRPAWQEKDVEDKQPLRPYYVRAGDIVKLGPLPYLNGLRGLASIVIQLYHIAPMGTKGLNVIGSVALSTHFILGGFFTTGILLKLLVSAGGGRALTALCPADSRHHRRRARRGTAR